MSGGETRGSGLCELWFKTGGMGSYYWQEGCEPSGRAAAGDEINHSRKRVIIFLFEARLGGCGQNSNPSHTWSAQHLFQTMRKK